MRRAWLVAVFALAVALALGGPLPAGEAKKKPQAPPPPPSEAFSKTLKDIPCRIVYETFRDGKYITFSRGPEKKNLKFAPEMIGIKAPGWNICVADASVESVWWEITSDGNSNKEPDWAPVKAGGQR